MIRLIDSILLNLMQPAAHGNGVRDDMDAARQRHRAAKRKEANARTVSRLFD